MASPVSRARSKPAANNGHFAHVALVALAVALLAAAGAGPAAASPPPPDPPVPLPDGEPEDLGGMLRQGSGPEVWLESAAFALVAGAYSQLPGSVKGGLATYLLACAGLIPEECVAVGPQLCIGLDASAGILTDPRTPVIYVKVGVGTAGVYAGYSERC